MTISVAIAAYRGEKFIGEQLASIAAQTVKVDEVVICDDSPDDLTENEIRKFDGILNIRYFRNPSSLGVAANFNKALSLASGDVVFLCDQDDVWYENKVEVMSALFARGAEAVFCDSDITGSTGNKLGFTHLQNRGYGDLCSGDIRLLDKQLEISCRRFPAAGHDMALSRTLLLELLPLPDLAACHDNYLGVAAAALDKWYIVPRSLGIFRRHGGNASGAGTKMGIFAQLREARNSVKNNTFAWNVSLFSAVIDRLPQLPEDRRQLLAARRGHSAARAAMNDRNFFRRLPLVWQEFCSGGYFCFGRGWKNIIQDIFLR